MYMCVHKHILRPTKSIFVMYISVSAGTNKIAQKHICTAAHTYPHIDLHIHTATRIHTGRKHT